MKASSAGFLHLLGAALTVGLQASVSRAAEPHFLPVPPVWEMVDQHVPEKPEPREHVLLLEIVRAVLTRRIDNGLGPQGSTWARDVNSVDEVPDSGWYQNRIGRRQLSAEDVFLGPLAHDGSSVPAPDDTLTILSAKSAGTRPGFVAKDSRGDRYIVELDPEGEEELKTGASVVGSRLFWALGYHVPPDSIYTLRRERLRIDPKAELKEGKQERPLKEADLDTLFGQVTRLPDGGYRVGLSRFLTGKILGPFAQEGRRKDDPNDRIPHEDRRSLRGMRVFAAWLNHTDVKEGNTLDSYVTEDGKSFVRHYLIDFDAVFIGGGKPESLSNGYEYGFDPYVLFRSTLSLGLWVKPWERIRPSGYRAAGAFVAEPFDLWAWKPALPNRYMNRMNDTDAFWAVRKLMALGDEQIDAAVSAGLYSDPAVAKYLADTLRQRRVKIARQVLARVNPAHKFTVTGDRRLRFEDLAIQSGLAEAAGTAWKVDLELRGPDVRKRLSSMELSSPEISLEAEPGPGEQLVARIRTQRAGRAVGDPVNVHLVRVQDGAAWSWRVAGIERWRTR